MIPLNAYIRSLMFLGALFYIFFMAMTYSHLVKDDFHNWVDYGKLTEKEANLLGLLLSIVWPMYWLYMLLYVIIIWIMIALTALCKLIFRK